MKEKINEESGARLKCVSVFLCPMTLSMSVCDYSDLSPLALCLHRPSGLHHTHTNIHTLLNPVRKSSQGPQGRQKKPPKTHKISPSLLIFPPLASTPSLLNPHLHIHRQRGSLRGLLSEMGQQHLLFVALQMEKSHFLFLSTMEVH